MGELTGNAARWLLRAASAAAAGLILASCHQNGLVFTVTTTADTVDVDRGDGVCADSAGVCSLRAAVMEADSSPGVDHIVLSDGVTYHLTIPDSGEDAFSANGDLDLHEAVVITGDATIDAGGLDRVFDLHLWNAGTVELDGVDLTGGRAELGSAIRVHDDNATLILLHSNIYANTSTDSPGYGGGAPIDFDGGKLFVWSSTFRDNIGVEAGAILAIGGRLDIQNTTMSGNTAWTFGGSGLTTVQTVVSVRFSSIVDNSGGLADWKSSSSTDTVRGSIVASCATDEGEIASAGYNIEHGQSCAFTSLGDLQDTDSMLGPLQYNGGKVLTRLPTPGSPAIDIHAPQPCTILGLDARGLPRPAGPACDAGAAELQAP